MDWLEEVNLAAWKYRNILATSGGPVQCLSIRELRQSGRPTSYQALATLKPELRDNDKDPYQIYGNVDGTGTANHRHLATSIAISEALERWAFYSLSKSADACKYRFDLEPTTTGMAAYPGLLKTTARSRARLEAIERWSVVHWWEGGLQARRLAALDVYHPNNAFHGIELITPWHEQTSTVIVWAQQSSWTYGFATGKIKKESIRRAIIELERNQDVLEHYFSTTNPADRGNEFDLPTQEKRLLFFSTPEGFDLFHNRVESSLAPHQLPDRPPLLVDQELPGPWSRYATVWRCFFVPASQRHLSTEPTFFMF